MRIRLSVYAACSGDASDGGIRDGRRGASIYGVTSCISEYNCRDPAVTTASYYETPDAPAGSGRCGSKQVKIIGTCRRDGLVSLSVFGRFGIGQFHCSPS